jgi:hypothetical protein
VDRVLNERDLTERERCLWLLVRASNDRSEGNRRDIMLDVAATLTADEIYLASMVIALFNFYNTFVDLHGVDELSADGYAASGMRLSSTGYTPPPRPGEL